MAQRLTESFINTNIPGAYFDAKVKSNPVGVSVSGNIVIIGEAAGGAAASSIDSVSGDLIKNNYFTPDQASEVINKYTSGPIVEAFRAIASPSNDANITGSASRIYIAKTNAGVKAYATMPTNYGTLKDKNFGVGGNKYNFLVSQSVSEVAPSEQGTTITSFGAALDAASFTIRVDGGAVNVITLGTGGHADVGSLVTELAALLPASIEVAAVGTNTIKLSYAVDASANSKGYGKSFELYDSTIGDLGKLGLSEGLYVSAAEPEVQIDVNRSDTNVNESFVAAADIGIYLGYEGTTASADVVAGQLIFTVAGGSGSSLTLNLADYVTIQDMVDYINTQTGYTASAGSSYAQISPSNLDEISSVGFASSTAGLEPGRIKVASYNVKTKLSQSNVLDFVANSTVGLPDVISSAVYLANGAKGATSSASIVSILTELESTTVNYVIPLFSQDAAVDIVDGTTDSGSTYTIDAINASVKSHVLKMSQSKYKRNRSGVVSYWGDYSDDKIKVSSLANARVLFCMQRSSQVDVNGNVTSFLPWYTACLGAGMQVAGFYKSITNKYVNNITFEDPNGFDSSNLGDMEDAIDAGILFMEKTITGNKWVVDQTTYGKDSNFVYNSMQAMYAGDLVALDLANSFQTTFVGQSLADVDAATAASYLDSKMKVYKDQRLIAASSDAPLGYRNVKISIVAPVMKIGVEIKLATAILFIPINIEFSQIQSQA